VCDAVLPFSIVKALTNVSNFLVAGRT